MNYLFDSHIVGYLPGHTSETNMNVVIICFIPEINIIENNNDIIVSNKISSIISIIDKNFNEYSMAVNSYDNNCHIFKKLTGLHLDLPLRLYKNMKNAFNIHKAHKIKHIIEYNDFGILIHEGVIINGLLSGKKKNKENVDTNIKDGLII
jgi:hypothetical protein